MAETTVNLKQFTNLWTTIFSGDQWRNGTIKAMLCTDVYSPNQDTHIYKSSVTGEVASGSGYTTGGITLSSKTTPVDPTTNITKYKAANISWAGVIIARYLVIYLDTGNAATSPLIGYADFGENVTSVGGTFPITWSENGITSITTAA